MSGWKIRGSEETKEMTIDAPTLFIVLRGAVVFFAAATMLSLFYAVNRKSHARGVVPRVFWLSLSSMLGSGSAVLFLADPNIQSLGRYGLGHTGRLVIGILLLAGAILVMGEGLFASRERLNKYIDNFARKMGTMSKEDA